MPVCLQLIPVRTEDCFDLGCGVRVLVCLALNVVGTVCYSYVNMPRVVPNQSEKFQNDDIFQKLSRETEVKLLEYITNVSRL